jgi:hypothetical protein
VDELEGGPEAPPAGICARLQARAQPLTLLSIAVSFGIGFFGGMLIGSGTGKREA